MLEIENCLEGKKEKLAFGKKCFDTEYQCKEEAKEN